LAVNTNVLPKLRNQHISGSKILSRVRTGLEKIAQSLAEQLPTQLDENLLARKNRLERLGVIALSILKPGYSVSSYIWSATS